MLTIAQVADKLQVSEGLVRKWIGTGELPHYRLGNRIRVDQADLDGFLAGRRKGEKKVIPLAAGYVEYHKEVMADIERKSARRASASPPGRRERASRPAPT